MSTERKQLPLAAALFCVTAPSAAFDGLSDNLNAASQGVTFYISVPLDAPRAKHQTFGAGFMVQGKGQAEAFSVDSRMFNNFLGTGLEAKWVIAGVVAAGAAVAVGSRSKSTTQQYQQQQEQQQVAQQQAVQQQQSQQQNGGPNGPPAPCPVKPTCP